MEFYHRTDKSIKSLVKLGMHGHFPLFENSWIKENSNDRKKLTGNEKVKAKKLSNRLCQHNSLQRKKTILFSMNNSERTLLVKAFFKMVEHKIIDQGVELH